MIVVNFHCRAGYLFIRTAQDLTLSTITIFGALCRLRLGDNKTAAQDDLLEVASAEQRGRVICHFHHRQLVSQLGIILLYMLCKCTRGVQKVYEKLSETSPSATSCMASGSIPAKL